MKRRRREVDEAEIDMTPMLDVTFIMLIFFVVTTSFVTVSGINVSRPASAPTQVKKQQKVIVIRITSSGTIVMNNRQISVDAIQSNVQKGLAAHPKGTVVIVAAARAPAGLTVQAIDQARAAGAANVSIATTKGTGT